MCASVITVIAPFNSSTLREMAGQHHLDMHAGTRTAIASRDKVSGVGRLQQEGKLRNHCHVRLSVRLSLCVCACVRTVRLPSLSLSPFIALSLVTFFLSLAALQSLSSIFSHTSPSPASSYFEIRGSVFETQRLQNVGERGP